MAWSRMHSCEDLPVGGPAGAGHLESTAIIFYAHVERWSVHDAGDPDDEHPSPGRCRTRRWSGESRPMGGCGRDHLEDGRARPSTTTNQPMARPRDAHHQAQEIAREGLLDAHPGGLGGWPRPVGWPCGSSPRTFDDLARGPRAWFREPRWCPPPAPAPKKRPRSRTGERERACLRFHFLVGHRISCVGWWMKFFLMPAASGRAGRVST